jgi:glycosyltransferase involved in cell wall biosynthesis
VRRLPRDVGHAGPSAPAPAAEVFDSAATAAGSPVTVIIPTRDRGELLLRSVCGALGQVDVEVRIVVVDDGSSVPVASLPALQSVFSDHRVRLLRNERSEGVAAARNRGIANASTPWVAFLDDDDLWAPEKLCAQLHALAERPECQWTYTGEAILRSDLSVLWANAGPPGEGIDAQLLENNRIPGGGSSVVAARVAVERLGGFDESFSILADWDLWLRLALRSAPAPVEAPLVGYLEHPGGMSHDIRRSLSEFGRIDRKYSELREARGIAIGCHDYLLWLADLDRRCGRRWRAASLSAKAALAGRDPRALAFAAATLTWPGFGRELDRRARDKCPIELRQAAANWLTLIEPMSSPPPRRTRR